MDGTNGIAYKLNRIVRRLIQLTNTSDRPKELQGTAESQRPGHCYQLFDRRLHDILERTQAALFPALATNLGLSPRESLKQFQALAEKLRLTTLLFLSGTLLYVGFGPDILPLSSFSMNVGQLSACLLLTMAFRLQRSGITATMPAKLRISLDAVTPVKYRSQLTTIQEWLPFERFSPKDVPVRSAALALTALLMLFAPSYPVVQWFGGHPWTAQVS
jgi:hypothetical protein